MGIFSRMGDIINSKTPPAISQSAKSSHAKQRLIKSAQRNGPKRQKSRSIKTAKILPAAHYKPSSKPKI